MRSHLGACVYVSAVQPLTRAVLRLPLQTLAVGEGDDVGRRVDAALRAAAPHALHGLAGAVGAAGAQRAGRLAGPGARALRTPWAATQPTQQRLHERSQVTDVVLTCFAAPVIRT